MELHDAERYILLGLRLGRHVNGLVDAYYGPGELASRVVAEPLAPPAELAREAAALRRELSGDKSDRARWLSAQLDGLAAVAERLGGRALSYREEVRRCYGVELEAASDDGFAAAHDALDALLPGAGALRERFQAWQSAGTVPPEKVLFALKRMRDELRERTEHVFGLPDGESVDLETVSNEPWAAFNYYQGGLRSRVVFNTDVPIHAPTMASTTAHEAYPGHHTEHAWKEQLLVRGRDELEETIQMIGTPQCVVTEGIATNALAALGGGAEEACAEVLAELGLGYDVALAREIRDASKPLEYVWPNAALMVHERGAGVEEATAYARRWKLDTEARIAKSLEFMMHPVWRTYVVTYPVGERLVAAWSRGDPSRFRRLLKEQLTPSDLEVRS